MYDKVIWPEKYDTRVSAIHAFNDIHIKAPAAVVWNLMIDAEYWFNYFSPENQVKIYSEEKELTLGAKWAFVAVGLPMSLTVTEFEPLHRLSWATTIQACTLVGLLHKQGKDVTC